MSDDVIKDLANDLLDELGDINTLLKGNSMSVEEVAAIVKGVIGDMIEPVVPEVRVEATPTVEVTNEPADMEPIAKALVSVLSKPQPDINVEIPKRATAMDIEVTERDTFGNIVRLRVTEIA